MIEQRIEVSTPDGSMTTFVFHPEHDGPHPVVLYLMDAPSIRPALMDMASRLATAGYYVMLPFLFYRGSEFREFGQTDEEMHKRRELMGSVNLSNIVGDAEALLAVADADPAAQHGGKVGVIGFCMSGPLAISLARAMPDRVAAAACGEKRLEPLGVVPPSLLRRRVVVVGRFVENEFAELAGQRGSRRQGERCAGGKADDNRRSAHLVD